jgi:competence protein ComEC
VPAVVWFAVLYAAGIWAGILVAPPPWMLVGLALGVLLAGLSLGWRHRLLCALLAGAALGAIAQRNRAAGCAVRWLPGRHAAYVRLHDAPGTQGSASGTVLHAPERCGGRIRLRFPGDEHLNSGTLLVVVGTVRGRGWMRVEHLRPITASRRPLRFRIRDLVARRIRRLYGARAPLVEAMVLGRREDLDPDLRALFAAAGLAHLLAISGLHVGMVAAWMRLATRAVLGPRRSWLVSAAATWSYVAFLGFPAPATRAAAFVALYTSARLRQRRPPPAAVLAVASLVVLALDPGAVSSVGAWLSVSAVWGTGWAMRLAGSDRKGIVRLVAASCGATLATAPITAATFGSVAPVGVISNVLAVPLAGVAVPAVFASLLAGSVVAAGAGLVLAAVERVAAVAAALPYGHLAGEPGWAFAAPWAGLLLLAVWASWRRPAWRVIRLRVAAALAIASWCLAARPVAGGQADGRLTIHVLSVGQGDAIAIRTPRGRWILIDAGPRLGAMDAGRRIVVPFLRAHGVRRLDVAVVSHGDADHLGGVPAVLERMRPSVVVEPGQPLGTSLYREYLGAVDAFAGDWRAGRAGDTLVVDSVSLAVLHPSARWMARQVSPNENSIILHLRYGAFDALFTGDAGWPAESLLVRILRRVDLLKVGHHGSAGSTSAAFLSAVRPTAAVISVGRNRFGHPTPAVLHRLADYGIRVYRTDRDGTVTIRTDGDYFEIERGHRFGLTERIRCVFLTLLPSSDSSWIRSACTPRRQASSQTFSTTSP